MYDSKTQQDEEEEEAPNRKKKKRKKEAGMIFELKKKIITFMFRWN